MAPIDPIDPAVIALGCGCCFNLAKTINLETVSHGCCWVAFSQRAWAGGCGTDDQQEAAIPIHTPRQANP